MPHSITVKLLKELLAQLRDDDVLVPNSVRNLAIERDSKYIGFIDLLENYQTLEMLENGEVA